MALNEVTSKGNYYRRLKDASNKLWQRLSFWTAASDVEFDNGKKLQNTLGNVEGTTSSLTSNSSTYLATASAVYQLNSKITSFTGSLSNLYNAFVSKGTTPSAKTLEACTDAVAALYNVGYGTGYLAGKNAATVSLKIRVDAQMLDYGGTGQRCAVRLYINDTYVTEGLNDKDYDGVTVINYTYTNK